MLIIQTADLGDRRTAELWSKRERVEFEVDPHAAIERARVACARLVVLDYDAWLPGTVRELGAVADCTAATVPALVRGTMCNEFAQDLTSLALLRLTLDVSLRGYEDLGPRLESGLAHGPESATLPVLRELGAQLTREQHRVFGAMLSMGTRRAHASKVAAALAMSDRKFNMERAASGMPDFPDAMGVIFGLHAQHWIRVIGWSAGRVADTGRFSTEKRLNEYLTEHCGVTCAAIARGQTTIGAARVRKWFSIRPSISLIDPQA